jgi:hypothetical protein
MQSNDRAREGLSGAGRAARAAARLALTLWAVGALAGCGLLQERATRREALADPALDPAIRAAIEAKQIRVGMSKQQVTAAWGLHCWYCPGTRQTSQGDSWEYNPFGTGSYSYGAGTYLYFDRAGYLVYWSR